MCGFVVVLIFGLFAVRCLFSLLFDYGVVVLFSLMCLSVFVGFVGFVFWLLIWLVLVIGCGFCFGWSVVRLTCCFGCCCLLLFVWVLGLIDCVYVLRFCLLTVFW